MRDMELQSKISDLEKQIAEMPAGSIAKKTVKGKVYFYHRWTEDKKRREKYIPLSEVDSFRKQIERRKELEKERKKLLLQMPEKTAEVIAPFFKTNIRTGKSLYAFAAPVRQYRKRECFWKLRDFVYGEPRDRVLVLYGLRRTGKTTMIRQIFAEMDDAELAKAAFIQITAGDKLADVNRDLKILEEQGIHYVFLDEVTLLEDFIEGAALFSDVYAACGMKIVLSGTDSLGFLFTEDEQLYDRCILLHTTFIPYREFESVLGICGIDEYIRYGGTMSLGGVHYNELSTFSSKKSTDEYVNTAIARNIQHSLRCYQYGGHFRNLRDLYEKNELTSAINRVVEDINHHFTLEVLTQDFKSHDLGISANNLRRDRQNPTNILDCIDLFAVTDKLRHLLEICNKDEQAIELDDVHGAEIKEYLELLDLTVDIDVLSLPDVNRRFKRTVIAQPGLRYAQAEALIKSLLLDRTFSSLSLLERTAIQERILDEIKGRMMEDIVLLETVLANPRKQVFVLQFPVGEFDMVIFDPASASCQIFEIKHSTKATPFQYRHLTDAEKCAQTEHRYGTITGKTVLYRGENREIEGVQYQNVEEYLRCLDKPGKLA
ncbi:MAG: AAA family ATPase [Clostridium sp.]